MSLLDNMPHKVTHYRPDYDRDEIGGETVTLVSLEANVKCWVQNASMAEVTEYEKRDQRVTHKVFFPATREIRPGDVLTVTAGPSFVGTELKYQASSDRSAGLGVLQGAMCEEENNLRHATFLNS